MARNIHRDLDAFPGGESIDGRYVLAALVVLGAGAGISAWRGTETAAAWALPIVLILFFLGMVGPSPRDEIMHLSPDKPLH